MENRVFLGEKVDVGVFCTIIGITRLTIKPTRVGATKQGHCIFCSFTTVWLSQKNNNFVEKLLFFSVLQQCGSCTSKQGNCIFVRFTTVWLSKKIVKKKTTFFSFTTVWFSQKNDKKKHVFGPK